MLQKMSILFVIMAVAFVGPVLAATDVGVNDASGDYGTTVDVPINVSSTSNIGAMDISLTYNPAVISPTGVVANGTLISATDLIANNTATSGIVNVSVASLYGINGTESIAVIQFSVVGSGNATSPLTLSRADAYDLDNPTYNESGNCTGYAEISVTSTNGTFTATGEAALTGDISGDNVVNYIDLGILGATYGLSLGDAGYNAAADMSGDGVVNYIDLGMLGAHYGESV